MRNRLFSSNSNRRKKISVLGQNEGYMTLIDCDRLKKIKNAELMNKIFDTVKEIQEVLKIK